MNDIRTTDLELLKEGHWYTWGAIVTIHEIGPYAVIEAIDWQKNSSAIKVGTWDNDGPHSFHSYTDGKNLGRSYGTLEGALAFCMAYKFDPAKANSQAGEYFCRMIGVSE